MVNKCQYPKMEIEVKNLGKGYRRQEVKIVCAWCGKDMGKKDGKGVKGISHGICQECLAKVIAKMESKSSTGSEQDG